jgi:hypothetical protein
MPNKNIIIQIFQMAIGITKFSLLVTFYLDWGFILVRHRRASTSGALINQLLQMVSIKYWSKKFPLTNSTEVINTSWNSYNSLSTEANNQFELEIQYIIILSIVQLKFLVMEKLFNDSALARQLAVASLVAFEILFSPDMGKMLYRKFWNFKAT